MRILVLSDVHGNLTALEAVISKAGNVDATFCLGDIVGYGPDPNDCIELIRSLPNSTCILGNHDAALIGRIQTDSFNLEARESINGVKNTLSEANFNFLFALPELSINHEVTLVHGSPRDPIWEYILDTFTAKANLEYFDTQFCFIGHSHLPVIYEQKMNSMKWRLLQSNDIVKLNSRAILNPGSVGQPRDHDPRAAFAVFYPEEKIWESHRVDYDITSVQQRIIDSGLPARNALRLSDGW